MDHKFLAQVAEPRVIANSVVLQIAKQRAPDHALVAGNIDGSKRHRTFFGTGDSLRRQTALGDAVCRSRSLVHRVICRRYNASYL
jgi:hypothetical protein